MIEMREARERREEEELVGKLLVMKGIKEKTDHQTDHQTDHETDHETDRGDGTLGRGTLESGTLESGTLESGTLESGTLESATLESATLEGAILETATLEAASGFVPSKLFVAPRPGMCFKLGEHGLGFYPDALAPGTPPTPQNDPPRQKDPPPKEAAEAGIDGAEEEEVWREEPTVDYTRFDEIDDSHVSAGSDPPSDRPSDPPSDRPSDRPSAPPSNEDKPSLSRGGGSLSGGGSLFTPPEEETPPLPLNLPRSRAGEMAVFGTPPPPGEARAGHAATERAHPAAAAREGASREGGGREGWAGCWRRGRGICRGLGISPSRLETGRMWKEFGMGSQCKIWKNEGGFGDLEQLSI